MQDAMLYKFAPDVERGAGYWRAHNPEIPAVGDVNYFKLYISPEINKHYDDIGLSNIIVWALGEYRDGGILPFRLGRVQVHFDYQRVDASMTISLDDIGESYELKAVP